MKYGNSQVSYNNQMRNFAQSEKIDVEVIIPFHKVNNFLYSAIQSIREPIEFKFRIIAVNDTGKKISKEDIGLSTNDIILESERSGYQGALATGIKFLNSNYVAFLDSDDMSSENRIFNLYKAAIEKQSDIAIGRILKISNNGKIYKGKNILGDVPHSLNPWMKLLFGAHGADSTILARTDLIESTWNEHGRFSSNFSDYGWMLSLDKSTKIINVFESVYFYRMHESQMSRSQIIQRNWNPIHKLWLTNLNSIVSVGEVNINSEITDKISLSFAFPSSFTYIGINNFKTFRKLRKILINKVANLDKNTQNNIRYLIDLRGLISTRMLDFKYWRILPKLALTIFINFFRRYSYRNVQ